MIEWEDLQYQTAERFNGQLPHPDTAAAIGAAHQRNPQAVERIIDRVVAEYAAGGVRSPWGILKSRVENVRASTQAASRVNDAEKAVARAEQWIRTAGIHYDRETELLDELYGDRGILHKHPETQARIVALWHDVRPVGEQLEAEAEERGRRYAEQRARVDQAPKAKTGNLTVDQLKALAAKNSMPVVAALEEPA